MKKLDVMLFYRKPRETGNYSIESSFDKMIEVFPDGSRFKLNKKVSSFFSNGLMPRLKSIFEARQNRGVINHVTGDVNYLVFAFPAKSSVLTIHDCGLMSHPNYFARMILKWFWLKLPVCYSRYVTAVSEATKKDVIKYTKCSTDKVIVIPTIVSDDFSYSDKAFNKSCPRILHIGLAFNKNFERHVQALEHISCQLHVIGKLEACHVELLKKYKINYVNEYNVSEEAMIKAYQDCDLMLFASTLEGFGMPIVEAQITGRAVITSNVSSMPEIAGDGACLVDPYDVASITNGVLKVINDEDYRSELINKGVVNAKRFNAKRISEQYNNLYNMMV